MKPILIVISPKNFRDEELFETKDEIEKAGYKTIIASTIKGTCYGSKGGYATSEITLENVETKNYDGVVYIGGEGSRLFFENETALRIVKEMNSQEKIVGAICIAPVIIAKAGILKNKKVTVFNSEIDTIKKLGAIYTGTNVCSDEYIVTGNGPAVSRQFAKAIAEQLSTYELTK